MTIMILCILLGVASEKPMATFELPVATFEIKAPEAKPGPPKPNRPDKPTVASVGRDIAKGMTEPPRRPPDPFFRPARQSGGQNCTTGR